jgi:hypothetical protein
MKNLFAADEIQRQILRYLRDPSGGILRDAVIGPSLQCLGQRFLNYIFGPVDVLDAKNSRQGRNYLSRLMPEAMLHHLSNFSRGRHRTFGIGICRLH